MQGSIIARATSPLNYTLQPVRNAKFLPGQESHLPASVLDAVCLRPSDGAAATSSADKENSGHFAFEGSIGAPGCRKAGFEQSEWPERTPRAMLSTVKQQSRRICEAFSCNSIWVVVLEGLKLALSPHLLPLIRWIRPPPTYTFPLHRSSPWPQLPTKPCRWNTVITDHQPTTSTLIGWRGGAEMMPIRVRFRFHKDALSASVWDFPLKTKLLSTSHGGLKKLHSSFSNWWSWLETQRILTDEPIMSEALPVISHRPRRSRQGGQSHQPQSSQLSHKINCVCTSVSVRRVK